MKIAIITGGSRGLGKSAALHVAKKGIGIILTYNSNHEDANNVVSEIEKNGGTAVALKLDTAKTNSFSSFVTEIKNILKEKWSQDKFDYLVNKFLTTIKGIWAIPRPARQTDK